MSLFNNTVADLDNEEVLEKVATEFANMEDEEDDVTNSGFLSLEEFITKEPLEKISDEGMKSVINL